MAFERVLVVDDEAAIRRALDVLLGKLGFAEVTTCACLKEARQAFGNEGADVVLLDLNLPDGDGRDLLKELRDRVEPPLVIMMTGQATVENAVECMRQGAFDFIVKPFASRHMSVALERAAKYSHLVDLNRYLADGDSEERQMVGESEPMRNLRRLIRQVAPVSTTVLIQGESGTGKELIAAEIHRQSLRAKKPFVRVNCAAISSTLIESEFFGHEKGAFTGATTSRKGRFELADGGTILLDEISEITPELQAKLLRVLQEGEFERVGGNRTLSVDVRVLATTNRDIQKTVQEGHFREDLYYRLNVFPLIVPPLRERTGDITTLAKHFVNALARKAGVRPAGLSPAGIRALEEHHWPGNVRELRNVIERALILASDGQAIEPEHLGFTKLPDRAATSEPAGSPSPLSLAFDRTLPSWEEVERRYVLEVLEHEQGNRTRAAEVMGISLRTLRNKLRQYRLEGEAVTEPASGTSRETDKAVSRS